MYVMFEGKKEKNREIQYLWNNMVYADFKFFLERLRYGHYEQIDTCVLREATCSRFNQELYHVPIIVVTSRHARFAATRTMNKKFNNLFFTFLKKIKWNYNQLKFL